MVKFLDTLLGKSTPSYEDDYMDLDLEALEAEEEGAPALFVKIASIGDIKDSPRVKDEVYNGEHRYRGHCKAES